MSRKDVVLELRRLADKMAGTTAVIVFNMTLRDAADEIERLRVERDKLRQEICDWVSLSSHGKQDPKAVAKRYGWDCFKEVEP